MLARIPEKDRGDAADCAESVSHPAAQDKKDSIATFNDLPDDMVRVIAGNLYSSEAFNLRLVSKGLHGLFYVDAKNALTTQFVQHMLDSKRAEVEEKPEAKAEADAKVETLLKQHSFLLPSQFLQYVVMDEQEKAEDLLKRYPSLLYAKGTAIDFVGRRYQDYTAMQVAYATGNIALFPERGHRNMADMLKEYFVRENKGELIAAQIHEKFPDGDVHKPAFDFVAIFNAINQDQTTDEDVQAALALTEKDTPLWRALKDFRQQFHDFSLTELHFNHAHLLATFLLNKDRYANFKDHNRRRLYACQVIGCAERYLPAGDLKLLAQGLYSVHHGYSRQTGFSGAIEMEKSCRVLSDELGTKYWVVGHGRASSGLQYAQSAVDMASIINKICARKNRAFDELCPGLNYTTIGGKLNARRRS